MINCKIELDLSWSDLSQIYRTPEVVANPNANPLDPRIRPTSTSDATFKINSAKLYVPVITLSVYDNIIFSENINQRFKRTISWNKYRSKTTTQLKSNNLDYLIDLTFKNINWLPFLSLKNNVNDPT